MYNEYKDKGFEVVSVDGIGDPVEDIRAFMQEKGASFIGAINGSPTDVVKLFKVGGYPTNVVIGRDGGVVGKVVGYDMDKLRATLGKAGLE